LAVRRRGRLRRVAQQRERIRQIGILMAVAENDLLAQPWVWPRNSGCAAAARRRGDRITIIFATLHESACDPSRHLAASQNSVAIEGIADIGCD